jgi:hypothetical protein
MRRRRWVLGRSSGLVLHGESVHSCVLGEESPHQGQHLVERALEQEVATIEQVDLGVTSVVDERLGAGGTEDLVVPAPHREHGDPSAPEVVVESGVEADVGDVVLEESELGTVVARSPDEGGVMAPGVRADDRGIRNAMGVLPLDGSLAQSRPQGLLGLVVRVLRVVPDAAQKSSTKPAS